MEMKKYSIILYAVVALLFTGCREDETTMPTLNVIKSELNFDAKAQEGYIIMSQTGCQAYSSEEWCQTTVVNEKVIVKVDDNTSLEGRTARVTISSANGAQTVPVSQMGGFFRLDSETTQSISDIASSIELNIATPFDYNMTASASWMTLKKGTDAVEVEVEENRSGRPRMGTAILSCPALNKEITFTLYQYSINDLMGEWTAEYTDMNGSNRSIAVTLALQKQDIIVNGLPDDLTLKAKQKGENDFYFAIGEALGTYMGEYRIYQSGVDTNGEIHDTHDPLHPETRKVKYGKELMINSNGDCTLSFMADSTFSNGMEMKGLAVTAYDAQGNALGLVENYVNLILKR